jgi:hypothetical protein
LPQIKTIGYDQEIWFQSNYHPAYTDKKVFFMFTLNKDEIPLPHLGESFVQGAKIKVTRDFVEQYLKGMT